MRVSLLNSCDIALCHAGCFIAWDEVSLVIEGWDGCDCVDEDC